MKKINIIGHRGYGPTHSLPEGNPLNQHLPENSIAAIKHAIDNGADGIEVDIQVTEDGVPVLLHDKDLYFHSFGRFGENVGKKPLPAFDDIKDIDIGGGNRIPSFDKLIELLANYDRTIIVNLDVKDERSVEAITGYLNPLAEHISSQYVCSSYDWDLLASFRAASRDIRLIPAIKSHILYGADNVLMPDYIPLTTRFDPDAKWTLQELHERLGIDGLDCTFTDFQPALLDWAQEMGVGLQISTGNERVTAKNTDYDAINIMNRALTTSNIPFITCKVDEPDKVIAEFNRQFCTPPNADTAGQEPSKLVM